MDEAPPRSTSTPERDLGPPAGRRLAPVVVAGILAGFLLICLLVAKLTIMSTPALEWQLGYMRGGVPFNADAAQTMTVVPVQVAWFSCQVPVEPGTIPTFLMPDPESVRPEIAYTPLTVTITMRPDPAYYAVACPPDSPPKASYYPVPVQLGESLAGRTLLDGSTLPPSARTQTFSRAYTQPAADTASSGPDIAAVSRAFPLDDPVILFVGFIAMVVLWQFRWIVPWGVRRIGRMVGA